MPRTTTPRPRWSSPDEGASYAGVSSRTIRRRIADGSLPAHRFGPRLIKIDLNDLDQLFRPIPAAGDGAA
jgi:excisionase family DNA binding protein